jgi:hypothetical protein
MNLLRTSQTEALTQGQLTLGPLTLFTIEQPYAGNQKDISCVPAGTYELIPYDSPKHGSTWCLHNPDLGVYGNGPAPNGDRDYCEIHTGNIVEDVEGCIIVGTRTGTYQGEPAVLQSYVAFQQLLDALGHMSVGNTLSISNGF